MFLVRLADAQGAQHQHQHQHQHQQHHHHHQHLQHQQSTSTSTTDTTFTMPAASALSATVLQLKADYRSPSVACPLADGGSSASNSVGIGPYSGYIHDPSVFVSNLNFSGRFRSVFGRLNEIHFWEQGRTTLKLTENHRTRLVNVLGGAGRGPEPKLVDAGRPSSTQDVPKHGVLPS